MTVIDGCASGPCSSVRISRGQGSCSVPALSVSPAYALNKIGTMWVLDFASLGAGSIVFDIITDHKDWKGMQIDTYTPTDPSKTELSRACLVCV